MKKVFLSFPIKQSSIEMIRKENIIVDVQNVELDPERPKGENLVQIMNDYNGVMIGINQKLTPEMLSKVTSPCIVVTSSIGTDHIAKEWFESKLVTTKSLKTCNVVSVAEHIFALILALNKRVYESNSLVIDGKGHRNNLHERTSDISNKTLGLIGAGNITKEVIRFATAFQMKMLCYTKNPNKHDDLKKFVNFVSLEELLAESDIINISIPLNDETKNLVSTDKIALMKPTAIFINTSRAEVTDTQALIDYADKNSSFYVGLDIDIQENNAKLFSKNRCNVIVTPHTAGVSKEAIGRMDDEIAVEIIKAIKEQK